MIKPNYLLIALLLPFFMGNIKATTYYVDSQGGNDANSGISTSAAWNTISKVNSFGFNFGDTISFKAGSRFILTATFFPPNNNITFNSYDSGARPVIDGNGVYQCVQLGYPNNNGKSYITFNGIKFVNGAGINIALIECDHITFESCNIDSGKEGGIYSGLGSYLTIRNSTLSYHNTTKPYGGQHGIYVDGTDNVLMEYDTANYNAHSGFRVAYGYDNASTDSMIMRYCVSQFNGDYAVENDGNTNSSFYYNLFENNPANTWSGSIYIWNVYTPPTNCNYYNNTIITHGNGNMSVQIDNYSAISNIVFKNNIFYNTGSSSHVIWFNGISTPTGWTFNNNLYYSSVNDYSHFWNPTTSSDVSFATWQGYGYDANSIYANPLFNNYATGDYSLQSGSPAINSGTFVGLTTDINGNSVPSTYPDLGAFQHLTTQNIRANIKVLLQGPNNNGTMSTFLNSHNMIPLSQPFNSSPWNYSGSESVSKIPSNIVDWILVELRSTIANYAVVARRAAFLKNDGTIVDLDGSSSLQFNNINSGNYYIVIKYINTIETWSKNGGLLFTNTTVSYDFTSAQSQAYGNNLLLVGSKWCIYSGDINQDGIVDGDDLLSINNDNSTITYHVVKDLNGDGLVDLSDLIIDDDNNTNQIARIMPSGAL